MGKMVNSRDPKIEAGILKLGYSTEFQQRCPINDDTRNCSSEERAYFFILEQMALGEMPNEFLFNKLEENIPEEHRGRMKEIWQMVWHHRMEMLLNTVMLRQWWDNAPRIYQKGVEHIMETTITPLQERFRRAIKATIAHVPEYDGTSEPTKLQAWKKGDRAFRKEVFSEHKNYIVALRLYCEMLLEKSADRKESVLPVNHESRDSIMIWNRYLRVIDALHQSVAAAKGAHHRQKKRRLRKTEEVPYVKHSFDVTFNTLLDVVPYIIENRRLEHNPVIFALIGPIHDIVEDTKLSLRELNDFLKRLVDIYDSSIDSIIESGFGVEAEKIKSDKLDLMSDKLRTTLMHIIRILSNNTELTDAEKKQAAELSIAGLSKTANSVGVNYKTLCSWGISRKSVPKPKLTFQAYPEEYDDGKLTRFLLRMYAITKREKRRTQALIIKIEDKANNIETLPGLPPMQQRRDIRACITRLIAWIMLDHDNENYPLYNSAPRLIDNTVEAYERLMSRHPDAIEEVDHEYLSTLQSWQRQVKMYIEPSKVADIIRQYRVSTI